MKFIGENGMSRRVANTFAIVAALSFIAGIGHSTATAGTGDGAENYTIGTGQRPVSDGGRHLAYVREDGVPVVFDLRTRETVEIEGAEGCRPAAIGAGDVLLQCSSSSVYSEEPYRRARIAPVSGGPSTQFFKLSRTLGLGGIGRHWVSGTQACGGGCGPRSPWFINRRTGKIRIVDWAKHPNRDLDSKNLTKVYDHPGFRVKVKGEYAATCSNKKVVVSDTGGLLRMWTGPNSSRVIGKGLGTSFTCSGTVRFGEDRITWVRGQTLNNVEIGTGRKIQRKLHSNGYSILLIVEGGTVVLDRPEKTDPPGGRGYRMRFFALK